MRQIVRALRNQAKLAPRRLVKVRDRLLARARRPPVPHCGWLLAEENTTGHGRAGVTLRRYPYPYRCALAISNDTDWMSAQAFHEWHAFVNGTKPTVLGQGLGLEVGDSYWVWSENKYFSLYHSAPYETDLCVSPESERLVELGRLGWLDVLHGFGEWKSDWTIDRERIQFALDRLDALGIKSPVYVSHGGYNMAHNVGGAWGYYQKGDLQGDRSYCLDLLRASGFRYYWGDVFYELDKYGEHQAFASQADLDGAVASHDFQRYFWCNDPEDYTRSRDVFPGVSKADRVAWKKKLFNRVLIPARARDGQPLYFFKRFRGHDGPNAGNFILQVNAERLDALEAAQACVVVYQHFGAWRAINMGKKHASRRSTVSPVFDEHTVWAFRELAERQQAGRVFVTTTGRLLNYLWAREHLDYEVLTKGVDRVLQLHAIDCPTYGRTMLSDDLLQGLSFRIPRKWGGVRLEVDGMAAPPKVQRQSDPVDPDTDVLFIPWKRLEYPE